MFAPGRNAMNDLIDENRIKSGQKMLEMFENKVQYLGTVGDPTLVVPDVALLRSCLKQGGVEQIRTEALKLMPAANNLKSLQQVSLV